MNDETLKLIPRYLAHEIVVDPAVPTGQVEYRLPGQTPWREPVDLWVAKRRAEHKRERQNKQRGRLQKRR